LFTKLEYSTLHCIEDDIPLVTQFRPVHLVKTLKEQLPLDWEPPDHAIASPKRAAWPPEKLVLTNIPDTPAAQRYPPPSSSNKSDPEHEQLNKELSFT
jgi:hypothetical protein